MQAAGIHTTAKVQHNPEHELLHELACPLQVLEVHAVTLPDGEKEAALVAKGEEQPALFAAAGNSKPLV